MITEARAYTRHFSAASTIDQVEFISVLENFDRFVYGEMTKSNSKEFDHNLFVSVLLTLDNFFKAPKMHRPDFKNLNSHVVLYRLNKQYRNFVISVCVQIMYKFRELLNELQFSNKAYQIYKSIGGSKKHDLYQ